MTMGLISDATFMNRHVLFSPSIPKRHCESVTRIVKGRLQKHHFILSAVVFCNTRIDTCFFHCSLDL